jgi:hypothetical protein
MTRRTPAMKQRRAINLRLNRTQAASFRLTLPGADGLDTRRAGPFLPVAGVAARGHHLALQFVRCVCSQFIFFVQ